MPKDKKKPVVCSGDFYESDRYYYISMEDLYVGDTTRLFRICKRSARMSSESGYVGGSAHPNNLWTVEKRWDGHGDFKSVQTKLKRCADQEAAAFEVGLLEATWSV